MVHISRSDHPTDADLLEGLLARDTAPHPARCRRCAGRAQAIARAIDPAGEDAEASFDDLFYRRQAARIRARIPAGEPRRSSRRATLPELAWAGAAAAAVVALAVGLSRSRPVEGGRGSAFSLTGAARRFASAQDRADDRFLRRMDDILDEDPYDFEAASGRRRGSTSGTHRSS